MEVFELRSHLGVGECFQWGQFPTNFLSGIKDVVSVAKGVRPELGVHGNIPPVLGVYQRGTGSVLELPNPSFGYSRLEMRIDSAE